MIIKVKVLNKENNPQSKNAKVTHTKIETGVYESPVAALIKQLNKYTLSGDAPTDITESMKAAIDLLEEYEAYTDKLCAANELMAFELARYKVEFSKAVKIVKDLRKENANLSTKVAELEDTRKRHSELLNYFK